MNSDMGTLDSIIPGECVDIYYPDPDSSKKSCYATTQNTRYQQAFANLGAGVSVFTLPPGAGYQHIVVQLQLPDLTGANTGLAVPRGWGYSLLNRISYRVGGSSQYFITGQQCLNDCLRQATNGVAIDDLFALGGSQLTGAQLNGAGNYAYLWMALPWSKSTVEGMPAPLPTDLLSQQCQIQVELNPLSAIFTQSGVGPSPIPTQLASATFTAQQVQLASRSDELAQRINMRENTLSYPVSFTQQEVVVPLSGAAGPQSVSLTGFRSGSVKAMEIWLTRDSDATGTAPATAKNPNRTYAPASLQVTYAGEVYANYSASSYQLWNLINGKASPKVAGSTLTFGGGAYTGTPETYHWAELPFAQPFAVCETGARMLVGGKEITNGIVNLQVALPAALVAATDVKLRISYIYESVIVFGQGTADFAF
jgi:hypothetical protein